MKDELEMLLQKLEAKGIRDLNLSAVFSVPEEIKSLDSERLAELERSFRGWVDGAVRRDVRFSRKRILLIFLLIRYTGARLGEVLSLDEQKGIDLKSSTVTLGQKGEQEGGLLREVQIPPELGRELKEVLADESFSTIRGAAFKVDPGHVRRKFYERAEACGIPRELGTPNIIRKSRAIELLKNNLPLPVVQKILGHSTASLTASYLDISPREMQRVVKHFIDKESRRKTSARNSFFARVNRVKKGDIQSEVELKTLNGDLIVSVITNESRERLQLRENMFVTAEVKAPWVIIAKSEPVPKTSARNMMRGTVARIIRGKITTEFVVTLADGTEVCSLVTETSRKNLDLKKTDTVWVLFDAFSVILNAE